MCGSKAWLRPLAFRKAINDDAKAQYPLYPEIITSLNHQRYKCHTFDALDTSWDTLRSFLMFKEHEVDDDTVSELFAGTGENIRRVLQALSQGEEMLISSQREVTDLTESHLYSWAGKDLIALTEDSTGFLIVRAPAYAVMAQHVQANVLPKLVCNFV